MNDADLSIRLRIPGREGRLNLPITWNSSKICAQLFIHPNTLSYGLRKIEEFLKLDLTDGEVRATCIWPRASWPRKTEHSASTDLCNVPRFPTRPVWRRLRRCFPARTTSA